MDKTKEMLEKFISNYYFRKDIKIYKRQKEEEIKKKIETFFKEKQTS